MMGMIKKEYEENGEKYLVHFLVGVLRCIALDEIYDSYSALERLNKIRKVLEEYEEIKGMK